MTVERRETLGFDRFSRLSLVKKEGEIANKITAWMRPIQW
jgi:hypothetical protein